MTPLIPIKQVVVSFAGHEFLAVQLPGGQIAVVFRHFCEALDLNFVGQMQRIQANPTLSQNFLLVRITTPGGPQVVYVLTISVLSLWLGGFRLGRLSEEKRRIIIQLQEHAEAAFARPFQVSETVEPPKEEPKAPLPPASSSVAELLRTLAGTAMELAGRVEQDGVSLEQRLGLVERQQMADAAWKAEMHHQMQLQHEQIEVLWSVVLGRASAPEDALSADQQHTLQLLLHYHQQAKGQPTRAAEREVLGLVGAAGLHQLRQEDWKPILAWFRKQMER